MDLPPPGWYPDPYGVPRLLRYWDGSAWTEHTHADVATDTQSPVSPTTVQPAVTTVQPAVTSVQPAITTGQPQVQPIGGGDDEHGTRVLIMDGSVWNAPNTDSAGAADPYGYHRAQRRRQMWLMGGLAVGVAVALAVIALVVSSLGGHPAASNAATHPPASPAAARTTAPASPSPSPSLSPSPSDTGTSMVTDGTSSLSYTQLAAPWQPGCPGTLNNGQFTWTAGESAVAGQVNNGQTTWYGDACSGPLPQQYGYNGVADLENTANNLVNTFDGSYYGVLPHSRNNILSQPVSISGHPGWEIKFLMTYTNPQPMAWTNELGAVLVADLGTGAAPAVFYVSVPGNLDENNVDVLVSSLQVSATPTPGGSPAG
jgi:hypothetical protein